MANFITTHPSLFIITAAGVAIIVIFIYWKKKKFGRRKFETTSHEYSSSIELQRISPPLQDETDSANLQPHQNNLPKMHPKAAFPMGSISETEEYTEPSTSRLNNDMTSSSSLVSAKINSDVIYRNGNNINHDNRLSVSEVYKHGSYVSFDGDFDQFDDMSRASNVMRITLDFSKDDGQYVVPTKE